MKHCLSLFLIGLLLCGCTAPSVSGDPAPETASSQTTPASPAPEPLYAPGHPLEQSAPGALRVYPLSSPAQGILAMGDGLLLISDGDCTELTRLTGKNLAVCATVTLPFRLEIGDPSLRVNSDTLSYFDPNRQETVVLSDTLKEISRIAAPEGLVGSPLLSADRNTLFYCTANAIRGWNLETGIRRCIKELSYPVQELTGLHQSDTIVQCRISDGGQERTLFLAEDTGRLLQEVSGEVYLHAQGSGYFALVPEGAVRLPLFGQSSQDVRLLTPRDVYGKCFYLAGQNRVVSQTAGGALDCYDLSTGLRCATLEPDASFTLLSAVPRKDNAIFLLLSDADGSSLLCLWAPDAQACQTGDSHSYTGPEYTQEHPDTAALAHCQAEARRIGEKYGIEVLVWEDPLSVKPWDYSFQPEYLAPVLEQELAGLEQRLSYYPEEILSGIREHFSGLTICLVRQISGSAESGSVAEANGVQFFHDTHAYIAISVGEYAERALYHELYHVMETRLLTDSAAFDRWDSLNPAGFIYDLDYDSNTQRQAEAYLRPESRSFIDRYSMSFPKEDRARIMECAMESGNKALFSSPVMQSKLACLSQAIREAYGLKKSSETFRWEQYLK